MSNDPAGGRQLDLETRRIEADLEIRRGELEEKRAQRESDQKRYDRDAELKRLELTLAAGRGIKFTTAQATVAAAILALVSAVIGGGIQTWSARDVEASKNAALVQVEDLKAKANIALEKQKQEAAERLDRAKFETTLILKATESAEREDQIRNLKFFLEAGFISDPGNKITNMQEEQFPSNIQTSEDAVTATLRSFLSRGPEAVDAVRKYMNAHNLTMPIPFFLRSAQHAAERLALARELNLIK